MKAFVIDTHAWVWQLFFPSKLGEGALQALTAADQGNAYIYIPAVVLAEFLMIVQKRRIATLTPELAPKIIFAVQAHPSYSLQTLTPELVMTSQAYQQVPDIFDRLIVTEACQFGIPLITRDPIIIDSGLVTIVWN